MLVLSRQRDETIIIGNDIELTVVDIRGDKVRLGIKAPSHIAVHRKEVHDAIMEENQQAARIRSDRMEGVSCDVRTEGRRTALAAATRVNTESTRSAGRRIA
ncbi:MAG: carbon storage regulator CsrA [Planctomycetota bacterium]|jgi:carbon storage regulator